MSRLGVDSVVQDFRIEKFLGKGSYGGLSASLSLWLVGCPALCLSLAGWVAC